MKPFSLEKTYRDRHILLLGGLGFVGKILVAMLLEKLPTIGRITLILRPKKFSSAQDRLLENLRTSPAFSSLRAQLGDAFLEIATSKLVAIEGELSLPHFGIQSPSLVAKLQEETDLLINTAGLVSFNPPFAEAFNANVQGAIYATEFVKQAKKCSLLHVSTCYVSGNRSGYIPEEVHVDRSPNDRPFSISEELHTLQQLLRTTTDVAQLKKITQERAASWGWPNLYTYTKGLSEAWVASQSRELNCTIFRPAILESTLFFPFPGWTEGFNTSAPLLKSAENGLPLAIGNPKNIVDIVPVDLCCMHLIKVGAALLQKCQELVYQSASSERNPLSMGKMLQLMRKRHRLNARLRKNIPWLTRIGFWFDIRAIGPNHPLSCFTLRSLMNRWPKKWIGKGGFLHNLYQTVDALCHIVDTFLPFLYYTQVIYASRHVDKIAAIEPGWDRKVEDINWDDYWVHIQMPAVEKWCYPYAYANLFH